MLIKIESIICLIGHVEDKGRMREPLSIIEIDGEIGVKGLSCHVVRNEQEAVDLLFQVYSPLLSTSHRFL